MLRLIFDPEKKAQSATMPVSWCISKDTLEELKKNNILDPMILIITVKDMQEKSRQLAPLDALMDYIQFQTAGENKVIAMIVWSYEKTSKKRKKQLNKRFMTFSSICGGVKFYNYPVLDAEGELRDKIEYSGESAEITVDVPSQLFAKEPAKWEKRWVNLWHETSTIDECHFRKRRILAYTLQPPIMLAYVIIWPIMRFAAALFLALMGYTKVDWMPVLRVFSYNTDDIWSDLEYDKSTYMIRTIGKDAKFEHKTWYLSPFSPLFVILCFLLSYFYVINNVQFSSAWQAVSIQALIGFGAPVACSLFLLVVGLFACLLDYAVDAIGASYLEKWMRKDKEQLEKYEDKFQTLLCNGEFAPKMASLPPEKRTVHLRFWEVKGKVCKPYAK